MGTNQENSEAPNLVPVSKIAEALGPEKFEEALIKGEASKRAAKDPLPGPVFDAVLGQPIEVKTSVDTVDVRPVVAYDFTLFKQLNGPVYRNMIEGAKDAKDLEWTDEEGYELVYQFTNPCKEIRAALKKGREYFTELALTEIGDKYTIQDITTIIMAIVKQIEVGFSTRVDHDVIEDKEKSVDDKKK